MSDHECKICREITDDLGRLICRHSFCRSCITRWMELENSCPLCRKRFRVVRFPYSANIVAESKDQPISDFYDEDVFYEGEDEEDSDGEEEGNEGTNLREKEEEQARYAQCMVCNSGNNPHKLLLCDNPKCYKAAHIYCTKPSLRRVPASEWYCEDCRPSFENNFIDGPVSLRTRGAVNGRRTLPDSESLWSFSD